MTTPARKHLDAEGRIIAPVLAYWEQNLPHDSYFHAAVWDVATNTVETIEYGATAYGGPCHHPTGTTKDLSILAAAAESRRAWITRRVTYAGACSAHALTIGDAVTVARGRKVPKGTTGIVRWIGVDSYGKLRVGLGSGDARVYTAANNVDIDPNTIAGRLADFDAPARVDHAVADLAAGYGWTQEIRGMARVGYDPRDTDTYARLDRAGITF